MRLNGKCSVFETAFFYYGTSISSYVSTCAFSSSRHKFNTRCSEAFAQRGSVKKAFLEISQNSQENTRARVSFGIKLQA